MHWAGRGTAPDCSMCPPPSLRWPNARTLWTPFNPSCGRQELEAVSQTVLGGGKGATSPGEEPWAPRPTVDKGLLPVTGCLDTCWMLSLSLHLAWQCHLGCCFVGQSQAPQRAVVLRAWSLAHDPGVSSIPWKLVRNANSQALPRIY